MLGSCLVSAWRNLKCRKGYSIVNVCGLGLGLAAALFVVLFLGFELGYDRHFEKASRIFRAVTPEYTGSPYVFSGRVLGEVPEVEAVCAIKAAESSSFSEKVVLTVDGHRRFEDRMFYVEPSFFRIFGVHFIHGRLETALAHPRAVVLTRRAALRQFGTTECVGRVLLLEDKWPLQVEAVIEDPPGPSHFKFNMLVPAEAAAEFSGYDDRSEWGDWNYRVYLLLKPGASSADAERKLVRCFPEDVRRERAGSRLDPAGLRLQRLTDIHLRSHLRGEFEPNGDIRWVVFFSALGFLILAASVLNFVNLATAQALRRNREVGLRKVLGAARRQIAIQHLGEALLLTAAAAALGLFLLRLAFPLLREVVGPDLGWDGIPWTRIALLLPLIVLLAAVLAGLGVFGLTAFMVESRRREISIRKVLGADALRVLALVSRDFLRTLVVGASLAAPGVYAFARGWLAGFAYRIVLGPWFFAAGLGLVSALLLAAVGWHTLRAANADPAVVLRSE
jgi:putative ABC transport system permease protein